MVSASRAMGSKKAVVKSATVGGDTSAAGGRVRWCVYERVVLTVWEGVRISVSSRQARSVVGGGVRLLVIIVVGT